MLDNLHYVKSGENMPTFAEIEKSTGASRFLMRTLAEELDPNGEHRRIEGRTWVVDDHLAHLMAREAVKRKHERKATDTTPDALTAILDAHAREIAARDRELESVRAASAAEVDAANALVERLKSLLDERDRENERLRADLAEARADADEARRSLARVTGASAWTRAFRLPKLLGSVS